MSTAGFDPPRRYRFPFVESRRESPTAATFRFSTVGIGFRYRATQFVAIELDVDDPWAPVRRFSLSSSPTEEGVISITAKLTGSPYKDGLLALEPGTPVKVAGPFGHFVLDERRPAVMIAGGIGISPFRGMIRYAADTDGRQPIVLLYSSRTPDEFVFQKELNAIADRWSRLLVEYTVTRPRESLRGWDGHTGRVDERMVREAAEPLEQPVYYVCGTPDMVDDMVRLLLFGLRIPRADVLFEAFMGY